MRVFTLDSNIGGLMEKNPSADVAVKVKLSDGREITVKRLTLKGMMTLADVVRGEKLLEKLDLSKEDLTILDFVKDAAISAPAIAKGVIMATTNIKENEAETLPFDDALAIVEKAVEINNPERYLPALKKVFGLVPRVIGT